MKSKSIFNGVICGIISFCLIYFDLVGQINTNSDNLSINLFFVIIFALLAVATISLPFISIGYLLDGLFNTKSKTKEKR